MMMGLLGGYRWHRWRVPLAQAIPAVLFLMIVLTLLYRQQPNDASDSLRETNGDKEPVASEQSESCFSTFGPGSVPCS